MDRGGNGGTRTVPVVSLLEISRVLDETARLLRQHVAVSAEPEDRSGLRNPAESGEFVRAMLAIRRRRRDYFPFTSGDPAWSMLLELYAARVEGRRVYQTRLGVASGVAQTTALRLTRSFLEAGIAVARRDSADKRLLLIELSDSAAKRMRDYLEGSGIGALLA